LNFCGRTSQHIATVSSAKQSKTGLKLLDSMTTPVGDSWRVQCYALRNLFFVRLCNFRTALCATSIHGRNDISAMDRPRFIPLFRHSCVSFGESCRDESV